MARHADEQVEAEAALREWHMAAAETIGLNAMIRIVAEQARRLNVIVDLPEALDLANRNLAQVAQWIQAAEPRVKLARAAISKTVERDEWLRLSATLPAFLTSQTILAEIVTRYQAALQERHCGPTTNSQPGKQRFDVEAETAIILQRIDPDASTDDLEVVLRVAAFAASQGDPADARTYLIALRHRVHNDINPKAANRRLAAQWLQALEQPVVNAAISTREETQWTATVQDLRAVAASTAPLTEELGARAKMALELAVKIARLHYRRDVASRILSAYGYMITELSFDKQHASLQLTRIEWAEEHTAEVWFDEHGGLHGLLIRNVDNGGDDALLRENARYAEFNGHLANTAHEMSHVGIDGIVAHSHPRQDRGSEQDARSDRAVTKQSLPRSRRAGGRSVDPTQRHT